VLGISRDAPPFISPEQELVKILFFVMTVSQ
jgi:hypothetical protein